MERHLGVWSPSVLVPAGGPDTPSGRSLPSRTHPVALRPKHHPLAKAPSRRIGRGRRGDHEHRRARLSRHAVAVFPCADGSEAARPRRGCFAPERGRREAQGGGREAAAGGGFSIGGSGSVITTGGRGPKLFLPELLFPW